MPLPLIPIVLGAASLVTGAAGLKKGIDAKRDYERAREIGERAERKHRRAIKALEEKRETVFQQLVALGENKREVFERSARIIVDTVQQARAKAKVGGVALESLPADELATFKHDLAEMSSLDIASDSLRGAALAALGAGGIYGSVGALGAASTGTAIASLSGAAATNATLAWLGGGSLAAGGFGVAGGAYVLGGVVAGPALAIAGFALASKAEKALTEAEEYVAGVKEKIAQLQSIDVMLDGVSSNAAEIKMTLQRLETAFEMARQAYLRLAEGKNVVSARQRHAEDIDSAIMRMVAIFKAIKEAVQQPLLDEAQLPLVGIKERAAQILEVANIQSLNNPQETVLAGKR